MRTPNDEILPKRGQKPVEEWVWLPDNNKPINVFDALMRTEPGERPARTVDDAEELQQAVADVFLALDAETRFMMEALLYERLSQRGVGRRMGISKSQIHRVINEKLKQVGELMRSQEVVQNRYPELAPDTWDDAAALSVGYIRVQEASTLVKPLNLTVEQIKAQPLSDESRGLQYALALDLAATAYQYLKDKHPGELDNIVPMMISRHHKYGERNILGFHMTGVVIRMCDKVERINNSVRDFDDELIIDAYMDLVGYGAIAYMLMNGWFKLPLKPNE